MHKDSKMVLDLGLEIDVQKDGTKESSTCCFATDEATSNAGRILNENRCISLLFLLLPNSANEKALKCCTQVSKCHQRDSVLKVLKNVYPCNKKTLKSSLL